MRLVLFDIDGTLLNSQGMGRASMQRALMEVFGSPGNPSYRYDGKTDKQIVRDTMRLEGHSDDHIDSRMDQLLDLYLEGLRVGAKSGKFAVRPLAGVVEILDALEERDDIVLGLLTGNIEAGARIKLTAAGINPDRFRVNAFGSDHEHRPELPAIAQRRATETLGLNIAGERLVVIGDTPADIECGRSLGARAIGVASGHYTVEQLEAHNPYAAIPSLEDTEQVLETILNA
ncbi:MAG TPA: HAD hydrolase-like protein [Gemmatimonadaceae bacterium]|jgi:phosphoglycolate phosphatase-like HAD superfamily hydrolase|nr:HAD hydrolase-like protein [Gemmatimonadaceae bacterium]